MNIYRKLFENMGYFPFFTKALLDDFKPESSDIDLNRTQRKTLLFLTKESGKTMSELSERAVLEKGSFTTVIDKLIDEGLAERERDENDRRKIIVSITQKGRETAEKISEDLSRHLEEKLSQLPEENIREILETTEMVKRVSLKMTGCGEEKTV
ncbi:MAG TPA: MarR family transcriptional regulator [Thermotogota bacterium]|nr:MarR family transcriptional regulator [Thermotogota bacterium]HPJ88973.1 MarR family transcriptional regulator [Thermotogota bacterium]HPR95889.1 MarR family transcriptional regulator [Thermotogota bacterium]